MNKLPTLNSESFIKILKAMGFIKIRQKGSHVRLKAEDGMVTTIPLYKGKDIPKGLLRKIIREDLDLSLEEFFEIYEKYKKV